MKRSIVRTSILVGAATTAALLAVSAGFSVEPTRTDVVREDASWTCTETYYPELKGDGLLSLYNVNGAISIEPSDSEILTITAKKQVKKSGARLFGWSHTSGNQAGAAQALADLEVRITGDAAHRVVETKTRPGKTGYNGNVTYTVLLPRGASATLETTNGQVSVTGIEQNVEAETKNGSVLVKQAGAAVIARTVNGRIEIDQVNGPVKAHTTNGAIDVSRLQGGLDASTTNGSITCRYVGTLPENDTITCRTKNGGIALVAAPESNFALHATTKNGRIRSSFPLDVDGAVRSRNVEAIIGQGGSRVLLSTVNGSITLGDV